MSVNPVARATTARTDLITVLLGTWLMIGLFLDGYAHTNLIEELESFLTPWHAVFYSGFIATALWIVWTIADRAREASGARAAIAPGYGLAVVGIVLFAVGGIGDAIWHTALGIEQGIDALLSPTHLLLFSGIILILTTPIRATYLRSAGGRLVGLDRLSVTLSVTLSTALLAFFFFYLWAPGRPWVTEQPYNGVTGDGEFAVMVGIAAIMISNLVLLGPLAAVLRRWQPPFGLATVSWTAASGMTAVAFDLVLGLALLVGAVGGLVADLSVARTKAGPGNPRGAMMALTIPPLAAWSAYFIGIEFWGNLQWPPEIWGGAIVFAALSGVGLTTLSPPRRATAVEDAGTTSLAAVD
jgi:hypothetical protein